MKNSKEYSKEVQKFFRALKRKYPKVKKVSYDEPLDSLVCAIISENMDETETQSALKRFADYFVDLNDLRVSRIEEIIDVLGADTPVTRQTAVTLTKVLRAVFNKYNTISLEALKKMSKRPARGILEKFEDISPFAVNYCTLTSLRGHAVPLRRADAQGRRARRPRRGARRRRLDRGPVPRDPAARDRAVAQPRGRSR